MLIKKRKKQLTIYAAGAIEKAPDHGVGSRKKLKQILKGTGIKIISPCDFKYNQVKFPTMIEFKRHHSFAKTKKHFDIIVRGDIDAVKRSDVIAVYIDEYLGLGSTSECTVALALNKPVYGILADGFDKNNINGWLLGCLTKIFHSHEQFKQFIINEPIR